MDADDIAGISRARAIFDGHGWEAGSVVDDLAREACASAALAPQRLGSNDSNEAAT